MPLVNGKQFQQYNGKCAECHVEFTLYTERDDEPEFLDTLYCPACAVAITAYVIQIYEFQFALEK